MKAGICDDTGVRPLFQDVFSTCVALKERGGGRIRKEGMMLFYLKWKKLHRLQGPEQRSLSPPSSRSMSGDPGIWPLQHVDI